MHFLLSDPSRHGVVKDLTALQAAIINNNRIAPRLERGLLGAVIASVLFVSAASAESYTYGYDEIGRLITVEKQDGASLTHRVYEYDLASNRLKAASGTGPATSSNSAPVANPDFFIHTVSSDATLIDILANDTDPDGDPLQVINVTTPTWISSGQPAGTLFDIGNGQFQYLCPSVWFHMCDVFHNWYDQVLFEYTISDGRGGTSTEIVVLEHL